MAAESEILKEYLMALGFKIDPGSAKKFDETMFKFDKRVVSLAKGTLAVGVAAQTMVVQFSRAMEQLYYSTKKAETAAGNLKAYEYAGKQIGIGADGMRTAIEGMARAMRLNPGLAGLLKDLGVRVEGRDKADVLTDMVAALRKMPHYQAAQYASLFGIDPDTLLLLDQGLEKLQQAAALRKKMAADAGLDMEQAAKAGLEYANTLDTIKERLGVLGSLVSVKLLPAFRESANWLDRTLTNLTAVIGKINSLQDLGNAFQRGAKQTAKDVEDSSFWKWLTTPLTTRTAPIGYGGTTPVHKVTGAVTGGPAAQDMGNLPLGLRQNNPGNLRSWGNTPVLGGFANFGTPEAGLSAMAGNLQAYNRRGLNTISQIIGRWAPSSENNTDAYVKSVASQMKMGAGDELDLNNPEVMAKLMGAMIKHEQGMNPFSSAQLQQAALGRTVQVQNQTTINVTSPDPVTAGKQVAEQQTRVHADLVRNLGSNKVK